MPGCRIPCSEGSGGGRQVVDQRDQVCSSGFQQAASAGHAPGGEFGLAKAHTPGEQRGMDTHSSRSRAGPSSIDQDLALAQAERPLVEVTAGEDLGETRGLRASVRNSSRGSTPGRHDALQLGGDGGS